jgi:hypothetical protein
METDKLHQLQMIMDEIKLELERAEELRLVFKALASDRAEISSKTGHRTSMTLMFNYLGASIIHTCGNSRQLLTIAIFYTKNCGNARQ